MREKIIGVYKITNIHNGKVYIGGTIDIYRRWQQHRYLLSKGIHKSIYFQQAYDEFGKDSFSYEIIERLNDRTKLLEREQHYYDIYEPYKRDNGYNVNLNAKDCTGKVSRPESVAKMKKSLSIVLKGVNAGEHNGQCKHSDRTIRKVYRLGFKGRDLRYISKRCGLKYEYSMDILQGLRRKDLYDKYVAPLLNRGKILTIK